MDIITINQQIQQRLKQISLIRAEIRIRGENKARTLSEYEKAIAVNIIKLKHGDIAEIDGVKISGDKLQANLLEKVVRGMCFQEKLAMEEAGALYCRERFKKLVPYDRERFGDFPELLKPYLETFPLRIIYRNGKVAGRNDFIDILDRLDSQKKRMSVDVIVPTKNRENLTAQTVEKLLEQDYPNYRVIVCDQSDNPFAILPCQITVTSPDGTESWCTEEHHDITWTLQCTSGNVGIEYTTNGGLSW